MSGAKYCLATIATDSFVPGTLVMLRSFLQHNRWFDGDVVVLIDELSEESRRLLTTVCPRIAFLAASPELTARVDRLVAQLPVLQSRRIMFHSLEAFRLSGYDKMLYCDSDLLFRGSLAELFDRPDQLIASGDLVHYSTNSRTFNAGLILAGSQYLGEACFRELLEWTKPESFDLKRLALADQAVLNAYFSGRSCIVGGEFNFLLACHDEITRRSGVSLSTARVIHFNYGKKPWMPGESLRAAVNDPAVAAACRMWLNCFADQMEAM